jgi:phage terminase Nu1 subunit (DNA packaging protein)
MVERVSQRSFAKTAGIALSTLQHHIASGLVTVDERGKVDPEQAGPAMRDCINRSQSRKARKARGMDEDGAHGLETPGAGFIGAAGTGIGGAGREMDVAAVRMKRERVELAQAQIKLGQMSGALVEKALVETAQFNLARALRNSLQGIPARLADQLAAETDPVVIRRLLDAEIRHALEGAATAAAEMAGMDDVIEPEVPAQEEA